MCAPGPRGERPGSGYVAASAHLASSGQIGASPYGKLRAVARRAVARARQVGPMLRRHGSAENRQGVREPVRLGV